MYMERQSSKTGFLCIVLIEGRSSISDFVSWQAIPGLIPGLELKVVPVCLSLLFLAYQKFGEGGIGKRVICIKLEKGVFA